MEILIFTLGVGMTYFMVLYPCWRAQMEKNERDFKEVYHAFKLRMVRRFYPDLRHLSFYELEEEYDIEVMFNQIGLFNPNARGLEH